MSYPVEFQTSYDFPICELQASVKATAAVMGKDLPILTMEEWALLEQLIIVLKLFDDVTSAMSAEKYVTGGSVKHGV